MSDALYECMLTNRVMDIVHLQGNRPNGEQTNDGSVTRQPQRLLRQANGTLLDHVRYW